MTLSREARKAVSEALAALKRPVTVTSFTQPMETIECREARSIAEFLAESSPKVSADSADFVANGTLVRKHEIELIPAVSVTSREGACVRFEGPPAGFIFESLLEALKAASLPPEPVPQQLSWLSGLKKEFKLAVYSSPVCPEARSMAATAIRLAFLSGDVTTRIVSLPCFPHLAVKYGVKELPSAYVDGKAVAEGPLPEADFMKRLEAAAKG